MNATLSKVILKIWWGFLGIPEIVLTGQWGKIIFIIIWRFYFPFSFSSYEEYVVEFSSSFICDIVTDEDWMQKQIRES